jgi:RimJ/RimL family protein N-acetyltransferase
MTPYRIETPRLILRPWSPEDALAAKKAEDESRAHLRPFMIWADRDPETVEETIGKLRRFRHEFDTDDDWIYGAFDPKTGEVAGGTGLHARVGPGGIEIGYWVHASRTRKGLATEIAGALTRVAFEVHRVRWVEIRCASTNLASAGVPKKLGFAHEATLKGRIEIRKGVYDDAFVFTMFRKDYDASPAKQVATRAFDPAGRPLVLA